MDLRTFMIAIEYVAIAILFFELIFAVLQKPSEMQVHVVILTIASIVMFAGYVVEIQSVNAAEGMAAAALSYLGKPYVMGASFLFLCCAFGKKLPGWAKAAIYVYCAVFPVAVFTNKFHYLYYATVVFDETQKYSPMVMTHGPLYYLYVVTSIVFFLGCLYVIHTGYKNLKSKNRTQIAICSTLMVTSGIAGYVVYLMDLTSGFDSTMTGIFFGVVFLYFIFVRYKIFDALAAAKDYALNTSGIGLVVFDSKDRIMYYNLVAGDLMEKGLTAEYLKALECGTSTYVDKERVYQLNKKELNNDGIYYGGSIEINDITYSYNYEAQLEHDVKERTEKLEDMQRNLIASVANIIEARSLETGEHVKRATHYVEMIVAKLKENGKYADVLTDEYIDLLVSATALHDLGKISIPDAILLKPGKMTSDEFEIMKTHTGAGAEAIDNILDGLESPEYIALAKEIAKYHHEWWNGNGYQENLKGEEIPLSARIVAIADCFDAISSKRCYKDALSLEDTLEIIKSESGTHFDPELVDAFVSAINDIGIKNLDH